MEANATSLIRRREFKFAFIVAMLILVALLIWNSYLLATKKEFKDMGDYFFFRTDEEVGFVLQKPFLSRVFGDCCNEKGGHLYMTSHGFRKGEREGLWGPLCFLDGPFWSLGMADDVTIVRPKYFNYDNAQLEKRRNGKKSILTSS